MAGLALDSSTAAAATLTAALIPLLGIIAYLVHTLIDTQKQHLARLSASTDALHAMRETLNLHAAAQNDHAETQKRASDALDKVARMLEERSAAVAAAAAAALPRGSASAGSVSAERTRAEEDADLYRRKVEAMEGLRRLLEAQPTAIGQGEDQVLYKKRVEALEGLRRVLEMQPGAGGLGMGNGLKLKHGGVLKREKSGETLADTLMDL